MPLLTELIFKGRDVSAASTTRAVKAELQGLGGATNTFSTTHAPKFTAAVGSVGDAAAKVAPQMSAMGSAIAGAVGGLAAGFGIGLLQSIEQWVRALRDAVPEVAAMAEEIRNVSQRSGIAVEPLQQLTQAGEDLGVGSGSISTALRFLNRAIFNNEESFKRLGVSLTDADGKAKSTQVVFLEVADAMARLPDGATKTALALTLFGRGGSEIIPVLNQGAAGLRKMMDAMTEAGTVINEQGIKRLQELDDKLDRLKRRWDGFKLRIVVAVADTVNTVLPDEGAQDEQDAAVLKKFAEIRRGNQHVEENAPARAEAVTQAFTDAFGRPPTKEASIKAGLFVQGEDQFKGLDQIGQGVGPDTEAMRKANAQATDRLSAYREQQELAAAKEKEQLEKAAARAKEIAKERAERIAALVKASGLPIEVVRSVVDVEDAEKRRQEVIELLKKVGADDIDAIVRRAPQPAAGKSFVIPSVEETRKFYNRLAALTAEATREQEARLERMRQLVGKHNVSSAKIAELVKMMGEGPAERKLREFQEAKPVDVPNLTSGQLAALKQIEDLEKRRAAIEERMNRPAPTQFVGPATPAVGVDPEQFFKPPTDFHAALGEYIQETLAYMDSVDATRDRVQSGFNALGGSLQGGFSNTLRTLVFDTKKTGDAVVGIFKGVVATVLDELAKISAAQVFMFVLKVVGAAAGVPEVPLPAGPGKFSGTSATAPVGPTLEANAPVTPPIDVNVEPPPPAEPPDVTVEAPAAPRLEVPAPTIAPAAPVPAPEVNVEQPAPTVMPVPRVDVAAAAPTPAPEVSVERAPERPAPAAPKVTVLPQPAPRQEPPQIAVGAPAVTVQPSKQPGPVVVPAPRVDVAAVTSAPNVNVAAPAPTIVPAPRVDVAAARQSPPNVSVTTPAPAAPVVNVPAQPAAPPVTVQAPAVNVAPQTPVAPTVNVQTPAAPRLEVPAPKVATVEKPTAAPLPPRSAPVRTEVPRGPAPLVIRIEGPRPVAPISRPTPASGPVTQRPATFVPATRVIERTVERPTPAAAARVQVQTIPLRMPTASIMTVPTSALTQRATPPPAAAATQAPQLSPAARPASGPWPEPRQVNINLRTSVTAFSTKDGIDQARDPNGLFREVERRLEEIANQ